MISREGAGGPFITGAEQRCGVPAGKSEVEIDLEYSILAK